MLACADMLVFSRNMHVTPVSVENIGILRFYQLLTDFDVL